MGRRATVNLGSAAIAASKRSSRGEQSLKDVISSIAEERRNSTTKSARDRCQTAPPTSFALGSVTEDGPSLSRQDTPTSLESGKTIVESLGSPQVTSSNRGSKALLTEPAPFSDLEALLAEQRIANERALQLNEMIALQLAADRRLGLKKASEEAVDSRSSSMVSAQPKISVNSRPGGHAELSEPLLASHVHHDHLAHHDHHHDSTLALGGMRAHKRRAESPTADSSSKKGNSGLMRGMSTHLFPKNDGVKEVVGESLAQKAQAEDQDDDIYKSNCIFSRLARNPVFMNCTLVVIVMNTLWIAVDTDMNKKELLAEADWQFQVMDNFFCTYFFVEMLIRYLASKTTRIALSDPWFAFDGFLVTLMIWETWIETLLWTVGLASSGGGFGAGSVLRIFRIFRLLRVARTARVLSSVPELLILTKGILVAMRSVVVILGLLAFIIYIFSIVFTQLLAGTKTNTLVGSVFSTVPSSANFLLLQVLCGFDSDTADTLRQNSIICYIMFLLYLLIGSMTILNMLIGILCDVVFTVADDHKEDTFQREMQIKVQSLASSLDVNNRGVVAAADFEQVIQQPDVISSLDELGVDVTGLVEFAMFVFQDSEDLSYENFLHMVLQFRTGKPATVKDVMDLRKQVSGQIAHMLEAYEETGTQFRFLQSRLWDMDSKQKALSMQGSSKDGKREKAEAKEGSMGQSQSSISKSSPAAAMACSVSIASSPGSSCWSEPASNPTSPPASAAGAPVLRSSSFASASLAHATLTNTTPTTNITPGSSLSVASASRTPSYPLPPASARSITPPLGPLLSPASAIFPALSSSIAAPTPTSVVPPRALSSSYGAGVLTPTRGPSQGPSRTTSPSPAPLAGASAAAPATRSAANLVAGPSMASSHPAPSVASGLIRYPSPISFAKINETNTISKYPFSPARTTV